MKTNIITIVAFAICVSNAPNIREEATNSGEQSSSAAVPASASQTEKAKVKALPEVPNRAVSPGYIAGSREMIKALNVDPMRLKKVSSKK